ncbi:MAG: (Fe-S)-binding protein [Deltaproteobacteria bacterium]|nr:(Fe-S)-binding protein [Deltaproteobacteria bacterium]
MTEADMDLLKRYKREIEYCTFCPRLCRFVCPTALAEDNETYTPTSKMTLVYLAEIASARPEEVKKAFYMCVDCKHCMTPCIHKIDVPKVLIAARAKAFRSGIADDNVKRFADALEKYDHPYSRIMGDNLKEVVDAGHRTRPAVADTEPSAAPGGTQAGPAPTVDGGKERVLYFPGCTALRFDKELVKDAMGLLSRLGIRTDIMDEPLCCGYPGYASGNMDWFMKVASRMKQVLDGYDTVVSTCPTCITTFRTLYHRHGIDIKARPVHMLEYIAPAVRPLLDGRKKEDTTAAYHDPCHLGRHLGVYDVPREIIDRLYERRVELLWNRDDANCCGGGGAVPLTLPGTSGKIARKRMGEFRSTGADVLLTACPSCVRWLQKADGDAKVMDITRVLIDRLAE